MDFIDNLAAIGRDAAEKAKDTAEVLKWRTKISLEKDKINKIYEEIGRLFVSLNEESPSEEYFEFYSQLDETKQLIEQYEDELSKLKKDSGRSFGRSAVIICPYCGEEIEESSIYCPKCGKNIYK